jgi:hypothetical protein
MRLLNEESSWRHPLASSLRRFFNPAYQPSLRSCFAIIISVFFLSRILFWTLGIRFDSSPLSFYLQFIDPALLQHDFWRSIFYLEQQPPLFNFFIGAVLHLVPHNPTLGFYAVYFCLGLVISTGLFALMDRMKVGRRIALVIAIVFVVSPSTVLYENLLFYEYPLTALLLIAAWFLHRYSDTRRLRDGVLFFSCLALASGIRSVYNIVWFGITVIFISFALRQNVRRTVLAALIPGIIIFTFAAKEVILFHELTPGQDLQEATNLLIMGLGRVSPKQLDDLAASGRISPILPLLKADASFFFDRLGNQESVARIVPRPTPAGIPVLDECIKSTGSQNANCSWLKNVSTLCLRDLFVVLPIYPRGFLRYVTWNCLRWFLPDTDGWPFDGRPNGTNYQILARPLAAYNLLLAGEWPPRFSRPWISYFAFPGLLVFGLLQVVRGKQSIGVNALTLGFMLWQTFYLTMLVLVFSSADHNRYRSEVSPYFCVLLGMFLTALLRRFSPVVE